jgi:hypothetical protein
MVIVVRDRPRRSLMIAEHAVCTSKGRLFVLREGRSPRQQRASLGQ